MIINARLDEFDKYIFDLVAESFPLIRSTSMTSEEVRSGLTHMTMDLQPLLNYILPNIPPEFTAIIKNPILYNEISSIFLMQIHQK